MRQSVKRAEIGKPSLAHKFNHITEAQMKYNFYLENYNRIKQAMISIRIPTISKLLGSEESDMNLNAVQVPNDVEPINNDISSDNHCESSHFDNFSPEVRNYISEEDDIDVIGSTSTISILRNVKLERLNTRRLTSRESYPVHVVNVQIPVKAKKQEKKKLVKVIQKGNFFEIISEKPDKANKYRVWGDQKKWFRKGVALALKFHDEGLYYENSGSIWIV
ncbi:hypothetical protein NPIL_116141 [Nephila pilipes]|uniref:Uncharacterized protein n=1 Tax=Nephila pilipes TaxID=299642 RepID=A0A8X6TC17_NEPPI|nr:hypothetical protein NPIL_116141 [Nephila pilipes]